MNYEDSIHTADTPDLLDLLQQIDAWHVPEETCSRILYESSHRADFDGMSSSNFLYTSPYASLRF